VNPPNRVVPHEPAARAVTSPRPVLKVCGATTFHDIDVLAEGGADLVGLWHGIPGGPADLPADRVVTLAGAARATGRLRPVLVTFLRDVAVLRDVVARSGIRWLQLHAFQPPAVVRALRAALPSEVAIVKVVHVRDGECLERRLLGAYERAGTDLFLIDAVTEDGRIGSTGRRLREADVLDLADQTDRPFLLAGGLRADSRDEFRSLVEHPRFFGIDVDTAARDRDGVFRPHLVRGIAQGWRTGRRPEEVM